MQKLIRLFLMFLALLGMTSCGKKEPAIPRTRIEGTVIARSALLNPAESNYPDCRFTLHFMGNAILEGPACNRELALTLEGFRNKKILPSDEIRAGDRIECIIVPFDSLPEKEQETQVADDLNLFRLNQYYVYEVRRIDAFSSASSAFADKHNGYISIFDRHINPPLSEELVTRQNLQIQEDREKMEELLKDYYRLGDKWNAAFRKARQTEMDKDPEGWNRIDIVSHECIWRNVEGSFWCFPVKDSLLRKYPDLNPEKLNALLALKHCCEANGTQLIVSVVPHCMDISARVIVKDARNIPDMRSAKLVKELSDAGIEALYGSDAILANFNRYPFAYMFAYDGHPGDTVQDVLAEQMAKRLERYQFKKTLDADKLSMKTGDHVYADKKECLFPENCDIGDNKPGTPYLCQCVYYDGEELTCDRNSEVLVIGNSYIRTPRGNPESYPAHLARHTLVNPDCYMVQGHGPMVTLIERLFRQPEKYLKGKKVVILQMGVEHFGMNVAWNNIETMDAYQQIMKGESVVKEFELASEKVESAVQINLPEKHEYLCTGETPKNIAKIDCAELDATKPIACLIPSSAEPDKICRLQCNGKTVEIPPYLSYAPTWNNLIFELPAGTKEIEVFVSGPDGALVAIQGITLLQ